MTAATVRPFVFHFPAVPGAAQLANALGTIGTHEWTIDAHGDPDWRRGVTLVLAEQIREELV